MDSHHVREADVGASVFHGLDDFRRSIVREIAVTGNDRGTEFATYRGDERIDGRKVRSLWTDFVGDLCSHEGHRRSNIDHLAPREFRACRLDIRVTVAVDCSEEILRIGWSRQKESFVLVVGKEFTGGVDSVAIIDKKGRVEDDRSSLRLSAMRSMRSVDRARPRS
jgi:hypothetical protein